MSTDMSAGRKSSANGTGREDVASQPSLATTNQPPVDVPGQAEAHQPAGAGAAAATPRLVYPPVAEVRPSSRPILAVALCTLLLLVAIGVVLVRHSVSGSALVGDTGAPTAGAATGAHVTSDVAFGPGLVVSQSQHVVFDHPVSNITLAVPKSAVTAGGGAFDPRIGNLQILLGDGTPLHVQQSLHAGASVAVVLPSPTSQLDIVYVAYHSVVRSRPSTRHRAAALVTPLTLSPSSAMTSTLHIDGTNITNIGCTSPGGVSRSCGSESSHGWTVTRSPAENDVAVIAQLDLRH